MPRRRRTIDYNRYIVNIPTSESRIDTSWEYQKLSYGPVPYFSLYRYTTFFDKILLVIAVLLCTIAALCNSMLSWTFGEATGILVDFVYIRDNGTTGDALEKADKTMVDAVMRHLTVTIALGTFVLVLSYISTVIFGNCALRQTLKIRKLFLAKILNQDIAWYDINQTGDFASRITEDLKRLEEGLGDKVSNFLFFSVTCMSSIALALVQGWELALICMITFPAVGISMCCVAWMSSRLSQEEMEAYSQAGAIAEETLSSIQTVVAFGGEEKEHARYWQHLKFARKNNNRRHLIKGISQSVMWLVSYSTYSLAFWFGVQFILRERGLPPNEITYTPARMITVFFSILTALWFFSMSEPLVETFGIAKAAASKIFAIIECEPFLNRAKYRGIRLLGLKGSIRFENVKFRFPARPEVEGISFSIKAGEKVALVGPSGCGKSTCIQLIQRYYDPLEGNIYVDGINLKNLDLIWLRKSIGVVGQEPVLFETTVAQNIRYGKKNATRREILDAARMANAHDFISGLPQGYNTVVGERGIQLSGGQKQRIAIARALVREPAILLLDEVTSALDTSCEAVVQHSLAELPRKCTVVIVAHRLSTVKKADRIVVITHGKVQEEGTHNELLGKKGLYYQMVVTQFTNFEDNNSDDIEDSRNGSDEEHSKQSHHSTGTSVSQGAYKKNSNTLWGIMKLNAPEWWLIIIGCVMSVVIGASIPIYALVFGTIIGILSGEDSQYIRTRSCELAMDFLYIGCATGLATLLQIYCLSVAGEKLAMRLRSQMFRAMLSQEMGWYKKPENSVGSLCRRLAGEPSKVQRASGQRLGMMLNSASTLIIAIGISFYLDWRLALVSSLFCPPMFIAMSMEEKLVSQASSKTQAALQHSTNLVVEAISNIHTVASLTLEKQIQRQYLAELNPYINVAKRNNHFRGVVYGLARSLIFYSYMVVLFYGALLVRRREIHYRVVFIISEALLTSCWTLAGAVAFTPNFHNGLKAARDIFALTHRVPKVQSGPGKPDERWKNENVEYTGVHFSYASRPNVMVLRGLDLVVLKGQMVALVGHSGSGRSTILQLLQRFYDPKKGVITIGGRDITSMNLQALRGQMGVVSQEHHFFSKTIAENIAYGDNRRTVSFEEIQEAAIKANAHDFIVSLPSGYETRLGEGGTQLSGGQKQRVAIARALVRNPRILILDEASSALDVESERVLQEALDQARVGRTCISVAHRLTTTQKADIIYVINQGKVAEKGTHNELLSRKGLYYGLWTLQSGERRASSIFDLF